MSTPDSFAVTFFVDHRAKTRNEQRVTLEGLAEVIRTTSAPAKDRLPWLKLCRFGDLPTEKGSLRWDGNVTEIEGVELDYDDEVVSFDAAVEIAEKAGLYCIIYTSPSHSAGKPRWRILCPTSAGLPPARRTRLVNRVNGLYGGIFAPETWSLSQSYYYGSINDNPAHQAELVDGLPIDELDELDEIAIGKPSGTAGNGAAGPAPGPLGQLGPLDEAALIEAIRTGAAYHTAAMRLLGRWANRGVCVMEAKQRLMDAFDDVFPADRDARWHARVAEIPRLLEHVWGKEAGKRDEKEAGFEDWLRRQPPSGGDDDEFVDIRVWDAADVIIAPIPPREWLLANIFCKQFISSLIGGGGGGKTAVRLVQALSVAIGRSLTGEYVHKRCRVLFLTFEDGRTELMRRLLAATLHHDVSAAEVQDWLFFANVSGHRLIETNVRGNRVPGTLEGWLRQTIKQLGVELVVLDPFIKTHGVEENDNTGMDSICVLLAQLAVELDIAVDYLHHVRKGPPDPGNADTGRGASAAKDAARLVYTLNGMTQEEAQLFNLKNETLRRSLVRQDSAKLNIAPPAVDTVWFRLFGVPLNNGTPNYPHGDVVQTVERWMPPDSWKKITTAVANRILDKIDQGPEPGRRYSPATQAKDRAAWHVVMDECPELNENQAKTVIAKWIETGVLVAREHTDSKDRHKKPGLFVGTRPGDSWEV